jgi:hypothetical protein
MLPYNKIHKYPYRNSTILNQQRERHTSNKQLVGQSIDKAVVDKPKFLVGIVNGGLFQAGIPNIVR